jgi:hypothetical protein
MLIFSKRDPLEQIIRISREQTAYFCFILIYILIFVYWLLRGSKGVGLILDIHIVMPICAVIFCYAPRSYCRTIVYLFIALATLNSAVGIFESATHTRLFNFDPDWEVLNQDYVRASAFLGHPLTNAAFTAVSLFVLLGVRLPTYLKSIIFLILLLSLVAFGGRSALGFSLLGLVVLGIREARRYTKSHRLTVMRFIVLISSLLIIPLLFLSLFYGILHSGMGERLLAYSSLNDESAEVRLWSLHVFDYMSPTDIVMGVNNDEISSIATHVGVAAPTTDIENPWILMLLFLGALLFPVWLAGLSCCLWRLMAGAPLPLKFAIIEYFCIASTSNSFGRKDAIYMLLAGIVVCAKRMDDVERPTKKLRTGI